MITDAFAERRQRESKQEHEFSFKNLIQMERCNRRGEWGGGGEHVKRKRETLENSERERKKQDEADVPFFCLAVHWGGGAVVRDWAADLCFVMMEFCP